MPVFSESSFRHKMMAYTVDTRGTVKLDKPCRLRSIKTFRSSVGESRQFYGRIISSRRYIASLDQPDLS